MMRHIGDRLHARAVHAGSWSGVPAMLGFVLVVAGGTGTVYSAFLAVTLRQLDTLVSPVECMGAGVRRERRGRAARAVAAADSGSSAGRRVRGRFRE